MRALPLAMLVAHGLLAACASGEHSRKEDGRISGTLDEIMAELELRVERVEGIGLPGIDAAWQIRTPGLRTWFVDDRVLLRPRDDVDRWDIELVFAGWGRGSALAPAPVVDTRVEGARLTLERGALDEWYLDRPDGLEQGFTLHSRPAGAGDLLLELSVTGGTARPHGDGVALYAEGLGRVLYDGLSVVDAEGAELPSSLELVGCEGPDHACAIRIRVDDTGAVWPLEVDPLLTSLEVLKTNLGGPGWGGYAVALGADRAIVGIPGNLGTNPTNGRALILARNEGAAGSWGIEQELSPGVATAGYGAAVAIDYPYAAVGAPGATTVYIYEHDGVGSWSLVAQRSKLGGAFGTAVALSGDAVLVGDPYLGANAGAVYAYHRLVSGGWGEVSLTHTGANANDALGSSVAIRGSTLIVGAPGAGTVRILERDGFSGGFPNFGESALLQEAGGRFGASLAFDGNRLAVGAPDASTVYLYDRDGQGGWARRATVTPPSPDTLGFGHTVAVDATTLAVGARNAANRGYAHLFEDAHAGPVASWVESIEVGSSSGAAPLPVAIGGDALIVGLPEQGADGGVGLFTRTAERWVQRGDTGGPVALGIAGSAQHIGAIMSLDGRYLAVGMPKHDLQGLDAGGVAVLERDGDDPARWTLDALLAPPTWAPNTEFGNAVSLDGSMLLVGAAMTDFEDLNAGRAYLYQRGVGGWSLGHTFVPPAPARNMYFGEAVALGNDFAMIAAGNEDSGRGAVYVYARHHGGAPDVWAHIQRIEGSAPAGRFGASLSVSYPWLAVGAPNDNAWAAGGGGVHVHRFTDANGLFALEATLGAGTPAGAALGTSIVLRDDLLLAGAPLAANGGLERGEARLYRRTSGAGTWEQEARLESPTPSNKHWFGSGLELLGDEAWVGSENGDRVDVFARNEGGRNAWNRTGTLAPTVTNTSFGTTIQTDGSLVLVGAPRFERYDGRIYVYRRDAPFAPTVADHAFDVNEDEELVGNVLVHAYDANGDTLTALRVSNPSHGTVTIDPDGSFRYVPNLDYNGSDSFTYRASDGEGFSAVGLVIVTVWPVNDAPVAYPDAYETEEDVPLSVAAPGVLANDVDVDVGDIITAQLVSPPSNGSVTLQANGAFTYQPHEGWSGVDTFTYRAYDGELYSEVTTVTLTVHFVPKKPEAYDSYWETPEDVPVVVPPPGLLAYSFSRDGDFLAAQLVDPPEHGFVIVRPNGSFEYHPPQYWHGQTSFTWTVSNGIDVSEPAVVDIVVHSVNNPPFAVDDAYQVVEDRILVVPAQTGVLANDYDVDEEHPHASIEAWLETPPMFGALLLARDGSFEYAPAPDYFGTDSFTYIAQDPDGGQSDPATVTITVLPENDAPVAVDDLYVYDPEVGLDVDAEEGVLANDHDVDNDELQAVLVDNPRNGTVELHPSGAFVYEPRSGFTGDDWFIYVADDGELISYPARVSILVTGSRPDPDGPGDDEEICEDVYYVDRDGDGYGDDLATVVACEPGPFLAEVGGDCDDHVASVHPGALEIPGDGIDQDCDGIDGGFSPVGACAVGAGPAPAAGLFIVFGLLMRRRRGGGTC